MNFFERRKILKNASAFDLTPIRIMNHAVDENGVVSILIPKFKNRIVKKYFEHLLKHPHIKLKLDEIGSAVWLLIDSDKKLGTIADELVVKFGEKIKPVEERLPKFISQLYEQSFISFKEIKGA